MTIQQSIRYFISHCKHEKNLSQKTLKFYELDLSQFQNSLSNKGNTPIEVVTKIELRQFVESIASLKPKSIKRKMATLRTMFNFLEFDDQISSNPARKVKLKLKEPKVLPIILELDEVTKILGALYKKRIQLLDTQNYSRKESLRDIVVIELLFATGGRVSEVAKLAVKDVDLNNGDILIKGKGSKERIVQVCNEETLSVLKTYSIEWNLHENRDGHFLINRLGNKLSEQSIRNLVTAISKKAGIPKHITPHVFRHSFATHLLERDVDIKYIQSLLGHSSIMTTQIYTHVSKSKQRELLTSKHPRKEISFGKVSLRMQDN